MAPAHVVEVDDLPPELMGTARPYVSMDDQPAPGRAEMGSDGHHLSAASSGATGEAPPAQLPARASMHGVEGKVGASWLHDLDRMARERLEAGEPEVWDALTRLFEARLITTALELTRG